MPLSLRRSSLCIQHPLRAPVVRARRRPWPRTDERNRCFNGAYGFFVSSSLSPSAVSPCLGGWICHQMSDLQRRCPRAERPCSPRSASTTVQRNLLPDSCVWATREMTEMELQGFSY